MREDLSAVDLFYLEEEFKALEGAKIEKVYQWDDDTFIFKCYNDGEKPHFKINLPGLAYFTEKSYKAPKTPPGYCTFLRKRFRGARISTVNQHGFDRILDIEIDGYNENYTLVVELFNPGNLVLLDEENNIIHPFKQQSYQDREIKSKHPYKYPKSQPDLDNMSVSELQEFFSERKEAVRALAVTLGLGGTYATEALTRANIDEQRTLADLSEKEKTRLSNAVKSLVIQEKEPVLIGDDVYPYPLRSAPEPTHELETMSEGIDAVIEVPQVLTEATPAKRKKKKYKVIAEAQRKQIENFQEEIDENQKKAEWLYEHYDDVSTLIYKAQEILATKGKKALKEALEDIPNFKEYNPEHNTVILEVDE